MPTSMKDCMKVLVTGTNGLIDRSLCTALVEGLQSAGSAIRCYQCRNAYVCDGVQRALGREPANFADYAPRIAACGTWNVKK
jgi:hypothetical protein